MTDKRYKLSRRNALAALGAVGVASAGTGLGTSAYFSDEEAFEQNTLTGGTLDLKVDWEEHYYDDNVGVDVVRSEPENPENYVGLPTADDPAIWVESGDVGSFMEQTAVEAYPDVDDDGSQDSFASVPGETTEDGIGYVCEDGADTTEDMDPTVADALRTNNSDTVDENGTPKPLVALDDVKPGDFGELTLSFHLCDNPGYVWATGELLENDENSVTDPEAQATGEDQLNDDPEDAFDGELAESIEAAVWYDSGTDGEWNKEEGDEQEGDNIHQFEEGENPIHERLIAKGSLQSVLSLFNAEPGYPLDASVGTLQDESDPDPGEEPPAEPDDGAETVTGDVEQSNLLQCSTISGNPHCEDLGLLSARKIDPPEDGTNTYSPAFDENEEITVEWSEGSGEATIWTTFPISAVIMKGGPNARVCLADGDEDGIALEDDDGVELGESGGDGAVFRTPVNPNNDQTYEVSHIQICYTPQNGDPPDNGDHTNGDRECFPASTTHYLGIAWWLPTEIGNKVQTDSVAFDLGFYTEQCRHNGSEMMTGNETNGTNETNT